VWDGVIYMTGTLIHDGNRTGLSTAVLTNKTLDDGTGLEILWNEHGCQSTLTIYPMAKYFEAFVTSDPINVTFAVGMGFFYTITIFLFYDRLVESRQRLILAKAKRSTAIVSS
jgi:hypothetical protein